MREGGLRDLLVQTQPAPPPRLWTTGCDEQMQPRILQAVVTGSSWTYLRPGPGTLSASVGAQVHQPLLHPCGTFGAR